VNKMYETIALILFLLFSSPIWVPVLMICITFLFVFIVFLLSLIMVPIIALIEIIFGK